MIEDANDTATPPRRFGAAMQRTASAYLRHWRRDLLVAFVLLGLFVPALRYVSSRWALEFNVPGEFCLGKHHHVWLIEKGVMPHRGEYIAFISHGIRYFPDGLAWGKILMGVPGDRIDVVEVTPAQRTADPDRYTGTVYVNQMPLKLPIAGFVSIVTPLGRTVARYMAYAKDTHFKPLPLITPGVISPGEYFVTGVPEIRRSLDSRYWGLVDKKYVIGKMLPVF
jgi:Signal peptidase, peptidase S26